MIEYIYVNILVLLTILLIMIFFKRSKVFLSEILKNTKYYLVKQLQLVIEKIINYLSKIEVVLNNNPVKNNLSLEDLTPNYTNENNNQIETYLEALKFAVTNKNVINIALTGGFGTGKSTIINEFCRKNRGNEYLHISLASFNDDKSDEKLIETSIVQQILYYEKKIKIKESSYKRINFTKPFRKLFFISLLTLWIYSVIFLFFKEINEKLIFFKDGKTNAESILFIFIAGVFFIFYRSYDKIINLKLSKLTPSSLEIVNENTDKNLSVFNRNIDEIIYFFEKTNTNIVIVEDIDRFNDHIAIKLYSKIRELSILIKQSKDVVQPVKFVYSVKDELILEDKTKFFDIIIPVIPITDYSNSKNVFLSKLAIFIEREDSEDELEQELKRYLDKNFISEVSNYVHDMRTVINICNEFKLYNKILITDKPNIDKNKLFAIIFYKNIFPEDFALIQKNESNLHRIFKKDFKKDRDIEKIILEIDNQLKLEKEKKNELENALSDLIVKDVNELRNIYIFNVMMMIYDKHNENINKIEGTVFGDDLIIDENFKKIKDSKNILFDYTYSSNYQSGISFKDVEDKVNVNLSYNDRENLIKDFHENKIVLLERKITSLSDEKEKIKNLSLYELYKNYNEGIDQFLEEVYTSKTRKMVDGKDKLNINIDLFKYLFKNDYLNEDFIEYVSYFHSGSLSPNDHKLMMKINQNEIASFDEKIDDVENLVKNIRDIRFKNKSILLYDIFEFLLNDSQDIHLRNVKLDFILNQIKGYNDLSISFIQGFIEKIKNNDNKIILSNFYIEITRWGSFWHLVKTKFANDIQREILFDLFQLFSDGTESNVLVKLNKNNELTNSINSDSDFLKDIYERISIDYFIDTLKILKVQFKLITPDEKIKDILFKVYKEDLYQVNIENLKLFSQIDDKYDYNENDFLQSNLGFLRSKSDSYLYKRISKELNVYIEKVYLRVEENIDEKSEVVLFLLEQSEEMINLKNKSEIVKKGFNNKLKSLEKIESKKIWSLLFEENKILASWENITKYYNFEGPYTSALTNFLNVNFLNLSIAKLYEELDVFFGSNEDCFGFIYSLINDENLSEKSFETIFQTSGDLVLKINGISIETRILFLVERDFFILDQEEFESLLEKNENILIRLIEKNEKDFILELDDYDFDIEFLEVLLDSKLSVDSLSSIIINNEERIIEDENLSLLKKITIFYIESKSLNFTAELLDLLLTSDIEESHKIGLFNLVASDEDTEYDLSDLLEKMGDKFVDIINDEDVSFVINKQNQTFLNILEENNLISSFKKHTSKRIFSVVYD